jgi:hypothetical protein
MAVGNLQVRKFEKNAMVWGGGDLVLVLLTWGVWAILKLEFNLAANPWRCSSCGARG